MPNSYRIVEEILKETSQDGRFDIYFTTIDSPNVNGEGALERITDYVEEHLDLEYNDINGAPALPEDTDNESPAYEGEVGARQIKGLQEVAFTGDYNSLKNKIKVPVDTNSESPAYETVQDENNEYIRQLKPLSELAFSGEVNVSNLNVSKVISLINMRINNEDNQYFQSLGNMNIFIQDAIPATGSTNVQSVFREALDGFNLNKRPTFFVTKSGCYFVLNAASIYIEVENSAPVERGYKFDLALVNESIISNDFISNISRTNAQKLEALNEISFNNTRQVVFIYDIYDHGVYCKIKEDTPIDWTQASVLAENVTGLKAVATSGSYTDLDNIPEFADIATSGSYNNLEDVPNTCNLLDLTNYENTNIGVSMQEDYEDLGETPNTFINDYSEFYKIGSNEEITLNDDLSVYIDEFLNNQKILFIKSNTTTFRVADIFIDENEDFIELCLVNMVNSNYASIRPNSFSLMELTFFNNFTAATEEVHSLIIDITYNFMYFK